MGPGHKARDDSGGWGEMFENDSLVGRRALYWTTEKHVWALRPPSNRSLYSERNGDVKVWRLPFGWRITRRDRGEA